MLPTVAAGDDRATSGTSAASAVTGAASVKSAPERVRGRFAPSPTGRMHAGNVFAALNAWLIAKSQGGSIVLRIEDLDEDRSRQEYADQIMRDFESLGLLWDEGPFYQHDRKDAYEAAYQHVCRNSKVYPCFCTRAELNAQSAPHLGERRVYDGRCRRLDSDEVARLTRLRENEGRHPSMRLVVPDVTISFLDAFQGSQSQDLSTQCGDFILRRADGGFAYQLAVVVDDAEQGITSVARGYDLMSSTPQQILLHDLLGLDVPAYAHFPLLCDPTGRRLAKRNRGASYAELLSVLGSPEAVLGHIAFVGGIRDVDEPASVDELLLAFDLTAARRAYQGHPGIEFDLC